MTTIGSIRRDLTSRLRPVAGDQAAVEADRLLGEVVGACPTELTLRYDETLTPMQCKQLDALAVDRLTGRPLAYVIGHVEFYGLDLLCDERVMIPRPETEEALEIALESLPAWTYGYQPIAVDVGTGSGNIALALARLRPDLRVIGIDTEADALAVACENCARLQLSERVKFIRGRSLSMLSETGRVDLIVSNPPYIAPGDPNVERSVSDYEPHTALFAGPSGLETIDELIDQALYVLRRGGTLVCEIGYDQAPQVAHLASPTLGWSAPEFFHDLAGIERVFTLRRLR
ncbi:MAG TPA: peptide chain release factor N(5)-glutamine methyltransferase [Acidobacteriota bacterium]|nr:peptide chain release factor N(5)-glutamine methyltransferase [Acidobacteriota bacterium]